MRMLTVPLNVEALAEVESSHILGVHPVELCLLRARVGSGVDKIGRQEVEHVARVDGDVFPEQQVHR